MSETKSRICSSACTGHRVHPIQVIGSPGQLIKYNVKLAHVGSNLFELTVDSTTSMVWAYEFQEIVKLLAAVPARKLTYRPKSGVLGVSAEDGASFSCFNLSTSAIKPCYS